MAESKKAKNDEVEVEVATAPNKPKPRRSNTKTEAAPTTAAEVKVKLDQQLMSRRSETARLAQHYKNEKKVRVSISAMYRPYFGNTMPIVLNGVPIYVPCDGAAYEIPESFAMEVYARIAKVEAQVQRQQNLSNAKDNFERYPGERDLIKRSN